MRIWVFLLLLCASVVAYQKVKSADRKIDLKPVKIAEAVEDYDDEEVEEAVKHHPRKRKEELIEEDEEDEEAAPKKEKHSKKVAEKRPETTDDEPWEICDGTTDEACVCGQNEINCDAIRYEDETELETTDLAPKDDKFVANFVFARENNIKKLVKGKIFPGQERNIAELDLSHNIISWIDKGAFATFKNLTKLKLSYNHLKAVRPSYFDGVLAKKLHQLSLDNNMIKSIDDGVFEKLDNLRKLILDGNPIKNLNRETFRGLENLEALSLDYCGLKEIPVNVFEYLPNLKELSLRGNPLTEVPRAVNALDKLEDLDLSRTHIQEFHQQSLKKDHSLKRLYMEEMPYFYSVQECAFCGLNSIEEIHLKNSSKLYHINPDAFGWVMDSDDKVQTLKELWLDNCNITEISDDLYDFTLEDEFKLGLGGNPINCTCNTAFLMEGEIFDFEYTNSIPKCRYPENLAGRPMASLRQSDACAELRTARRGNRFMQWLFIFLLLSFVSFTVYYLLTSGRLAALFQRKQLAQMSYANLNTKDDEQNLEGDFQPRPAEV